MADYSRTTYGQDRIDKVDMVQRVEVPDYVVQYAKGRGKGSDIGEWIMSLLPPEEKPQTLRDKVYDVVERMTDRSYGNLPSDPDWITEEVLKVIAADIKEHFGWETRITGYLKEQAQ